MKHLHKPKQISTTDELFEYRTVDKKRLKLTMVIIGVVMIVEIVGGYVTNSLALISDAGHMFTHFFALALCLAAMIYASKPGYSRQTYGFYRIEILAALLNSLFLFAVTFGILFVGIKRMIHPPEVLGLEMFIIAFIGLVVNLVSAYILWGANRQDLNIKSAFLHMLADTLSSVAIVIGAIIIYFARWNIIDPILSIIISLVIFKWGWGLFRDSINVLLESAPKGVTADIVTQALTKEIPEIMEITDLHIWEITSMMYSMTAHIKLKTEENFSQHKQILDKIKSIMDKQFNVEHTTIEID